MKTLSAISGVQCYLLLLLLSVPMGKKPKLDRQREAKGGQKAALKRASPRGGLFWLKVLPFAISSGHPYSSRGVGATLTHTLHKAGTEAQEADAELGHETMSSDARPGALSPGLPARRGPGPGTYPVHDEDPAGLALLLQLPAGNGHRVEEAEAPGRREERS